MPAPPWPLVFIPLFIAFLLEFVFSGLWSLAPAKPLQWFLLGSSLVLGLCWARWGSGSLRLAPVRRLGWLVPISLFMFWMEFRGLNVPVPWKGDEDFHILLSWTIAGRIADRPVILIVPLAALACCLIPAARPRWVLAAGAILGLGAVWGARLFEPDAYQMLRYPLLVKYVTAFPVYFFSLLAPAANPELPYRLLPFLSAVGLAYAVFAALGKRAYWLRLGMALVIVTLPLVRYYATIFYLEMPAVFCMTLVALRAGFLLNASRARLVESPAWYALLAIGYRKETTLPFLTAFLLIRWAGRLPALVKSIRSGVNSRIWREFREECIIAICVAFPLILYLAYRSGLGDPRPASFDLRNLCDPILVLRLAHSLWDSFGLLLVSAAAGALTMARRGKLRLLFFHALALILTVALHFFDLPIYIGYSRFNLFIVPGLLALSLEALRVAHMRVPILAGGLLAFALVINIHMSPINSDGTRRPYWGVYGEDTGEHYYPYREALRWLDAHYPDAKTRLTGNDFLYSARLYLRPGRVVDQLLVPPAPVGAESGLMDSLLALSSREGYEVVLYHLRGGEAAPGDTHGYGAPRVFRNQAHSLYLFSR